jgi:hypothetical protein
MRIGFLHTVPALAARFEADLVAAAPGSTAVHVVDAELLATAVRSGVDEAVDAAVALHIRHLAGSGADAVLVTCSSIGESVDRAAAGAGLPVIRVDRAMAAEAVALAGSARIAVLATLDATLGPTGRIIDTAAQGAVSRPTVTSRVVPGAAAARSAGDDATHDRLVAEAVAAAATEAAVVVLAQASMAPAAERAAVAVPVLTSPASALAAVIDAARRAG